MLIRKTCLLRMCDGQLKQVLYFLNMEHACNIHHVELMHSNEMYVCQDVASVSICLYQCVFLVNAPLHWCSTNTDDGGGLWCCPTARCSLPPSILFTLCHKHVEAAPPHASQPPHNGPHLHLQTNPSAWSLPPAQTHTGFPVFKSLSGIIH